MNKVRVVAKVVENKCLVIIHKPCIKEVINGQIALLPKLFGQGVNIHRSAKCPLSEFESKVYNALNIKATKEFGIGC